MGYLVLIISILVLIILTIRRVKQWSKKMKESLSGNYLLVKKYEKDGIYYGVFQQGDKEVTAQMTSALYVQLQPPVRGYLSIVNGKVHTFE